MPFPPFRTQGFQGCVGTGDQQPNCTTLPGEMLDDRPGFAVRIPSSWIDGEPRLREPTARAAAYAMWPAVAFDEAGPGQAYPLPANRSQEGNLTSTTDRAGPSEPGDDERRAPGPGLAALALGMTVAAGLAGRNLDRSSRPRNGELIWDDGGS